MTCDSDIEPDNLVPEYISAKKRLLELERNLAPPNSEDFDKDLAIAKSEARLRRIESDVLFDKFLAEQQWKKERVVVEKEIATAKKQTKEPEKKETVQEEGHEKNSSDGDINDEAQRIAAEILAENDDEDDDDIGGLFASLPQNEVDETTGKTQTVVTSSDGSKFVIRDFGKWTGVSPRRILEEACRSRFVGVQLGYLERWLIILQGHFSQDQLLSCIRGFVCKPPFSRHSVDQASGSTHHHSRHRCRDRCRFTPGHYHDE